MEIEQALELLKRVCSEFKGNLADHQAIQQALQIVEKAVKQDDAAKMAEPKEVKEPDGNN